MSWPNISRALDLISTDNGGHLLSYYVAGAPTPGEVLNGMFFYLVDAYGAEDFEVVEAFLGSLSDSELETVCQGEYTEAQLILSRSDDPDLIDNFLNHAFENMPGVQ